MKPSLFSLVKIFFVLPYFIKSKLHITIDCTRTLYNADVEAEPTANATPMIESAWKLSAYAIMTMPVIAIIVATICRIECK